MLSVKNLFLIPVLLSSAALAMPDGGELYERHCSACHQLDGAGGIGLPLTGRKLNDVSDEYLVKTIRLGRPGRVMPAFGEMSDAQVSAIVKHLRTTSGTSSHPFDRSPLNGDPSKGAALFGKHCQRCHGEDGMGEGKGTGVTLSRERSFLVMPAAIANPGFQAAASDRMIRHVIKMGRKQSGMPAFEKHGLSEQDMNDLVAHVRALGKAHRTRSELLSDDSLSHVTESPYDFETTINNIKSALTGANFRSFPDRFLEQGVTDEFSVNQRQVTLRFCNFNKMYGMLKIEPRLGVVLPCRVTVMERADGEVLLVTPNLNVVSRWFDNDELVDLWGAMEEIFNEIIEEATL